MTLGQIRKALAPAVLAIVAVVAEWIASGSLDEMELRTAIAGLFVAIVVYFVPNEPASTNSRIITP